jgi:DNA-binding NarL/FixJ family response regulator
VAGVSAARSLTVLVVDDDSRVRAAVVRLLDELPDVRAAAVDTEQATRLSSLTSLDTDVVVVDLPGPGSRGEALIRRLVPDVAVVAVGLDGAQRRAAVHAGAAVFVEKDGDDQALIDAIRAAAATTPRHNVSVAPGLTSHRREEHQRCPTN